MRKAKRGLGSYRVVCFSLLGALGLALSACGGGSGSATTGSTSTTSGTSTSSGTSDAGTSTSAGNTSTGGTTSGGTSSGSTTASTNITLAWTPPTENTDGSPLTDLVGYKIHYGTESQNYTSTLSVDNPGIATYVVQNLPAGKYYIAVTAYNSAGIESQLSDEVVASLN